MPDLGFRWSHRLYIRIYVAVLVSLAVVAILFGAMWRMNPDPAHVGQHFGAFAEIAAETLPPADAPLVVQQTALSRLYPRMQAALALYAADGELIAAAGHPLPPLDPEQTTSGWLGGKPPVFALRLPDGRWLLGERLHPPPPRVSPRSLFGALLLIALAVGAAAYPIVRRLTRRLERLQSSVEALGAGELSTRVPVEGNDEVARLAESFNRSAARIEALVDAQKSLLANASHELRSPLARIRMATELVQDKAPAALRDELTRNIAELDQLVDEILLASRLDAGADPGLPTEAVDFAALTAEECARVGAELAANTLMLEGDPKLLRRMVRNLLENARRYGNGSAIEVSLHAIADKVQLDVCDGGRGVPPEERERIFEPFYRLPGARERDGGVGLGLSLVRQIAHRHGGSVACIGRDQPGSCFRVLLPARQPSPAKQLPADAGSVIQK